MAVTPIEHSDSDTPLRKQRSEQLRPPHLWDGFRFFIGIPVMLGIVFALVGTRLTYGMPYFDALGYMILHMFVAWWSVNLGAMLMKFAFRSWRPPTIALCITGLLIALIPAALLFQALGDFYAAHYPIFATNRFDSVRPGWTLDYLLHFLRYSAPVLPTFLAGVYGYRAVSGVDWYSYAEPAVAQATPATVQPTEQSPQPATAQLINGSSLPDNARLFAIKAEEHYIKIWSDQGTDLVRYRFSDLAAALKDCAGIQTHRSWWVNLNCVKSHNNKGRKLELVLDDDLIVPVSVSHKHEVLEKLAAKQSL